jgi:predicted phosphohydrolase
MAIYAISDLHLSLGTNKPMDIFGWGDHTGIIKENWIRKIRYDDYVLIPGDISWGINLEEADPDFAFPAFQRPYPLKHTYHCCFLQLL